ncbi:MAG: LCP family protein, partial [Clostridia bacterium]|nr:LCP family protein [Clostridia bacterium]
MSDISEKDFWGEGKALANNKTKEKKTGLALVAALVVVFVAFAFAGFKLANHWLGNSPIVAEQGGEETGDETAPIANDNRMNILLLGTDQRANEPARADTVILAFLDLDSHDLKLLSIPRDTYVQIPGRGREKLAHANAYGGPKLTVETVEALLDVEIHRYVEINFEGFKEMIDTLGGIEMEVEKRMYYPEEDIDLHPGKQRLNGYDALAYVRFRNDALGDIGRINRQQKFLKELAEETLQFGTILKLPELIREANQSIETNFSATEMLSLAKAARAFDTGNIEATTLPGTSQYINQVSYWIPTTQDMEEIIKQYTSPKQTAKT